MTFDDRENTESFGVMCVVMAMWILFSDDIHEYLVRVMTSPTVTNLVDSARAMLSQ
jgi:hypothetical protein